MKRIGETMMYLDKILRKLAGIKTQLSKFNFYNTLLV